MIKRAITNIFLNGLALYATTLLIKDVAYTGGWKFFLIAGLIFAFLNAIVKPFLKLLSLPFIFLTAGLFIIVLNIFVLWLVKYIIGVAQFQDVTFTIVTTSAYLWTSVVFGAINWFEHILFTNKED
ncbi:MAG: phage holin family protein [Candidatus Gracilibacteria bacterium]|jgi:putative membrane protein